MSRQTLTTSDAIPDISAGQMHYRFLKTTTPLYLSSCGHLAVRLDEWPTTMPSWPCDMSLNQDNLPDVWAPTGCEVQAQELPGAKHPADQPPGYVQLDTAAMVEALASNRDEPAWLNQHDLQVGPLLYRNQLAPQSAGPHPEQVHGSKHGNNHADLDGSYGSSVGNEFD